ncbi:hypothetical protein HMPREF0971_02924 [Segatella oris F0302]|uniref:Uncharacterized protein n=1 Tax=Segatella oris F0302 TaxID=649760 RepID=D1QVE6_9BACT|nr:hypothetical protein [Segatella oris]EFB30667.1 hypothetical protein HMPREF0971_02924 [Segatella oris F0302]
MDEQKTEKNSFPTPWMNKKLEKTAFQPLGRTENWKKQLSNPLDEQKIEKNDFPTPWRQEDRCLNKITKPCNGILFILSRTGDY